MNLFSLAKAFPTEEHALAYWMKTRWPKGVRCIACDHPKCYLIETKGKTGKPVRLFECADCALHFSATTGTLFHDRHFFVRRGLGCDHSLQDRIELALLNQNFIGHNATPSFRACSAASRSSFSDRLISSTTSTNLSWPIRLFA